jgi:hypothetical protein
VSDSSPASKVFQTSVLARTFRLPELTRQLATAGQVPPDLILELTGSTIHQRGRDHPCGHVCGSVSIGGEVPLPPPGTAGCNAACALSYSCFATLPLSSEAKDCPAGVAFTPVSETISFALTSLP